MIMNKFGRASGMFPQQAPHVAECISAGWAEGCILHVIYGTTKMHKKVCRTAEHRCLAISYWFRSHKHYIFTNPSSHFRKLCGTNRYSRTLCTQEKNEIAFCNYVCIVQVSPLSCRWAERWQRTMAHFVRIVVIGRYTSGYTQDGPPINSCKSSCCKYFWNFGRSGVVKHGEDTVWRKDDDSDASHPFYLCLRNGNEIRWKIVRVFVCWIKVELKLHKSSIFAETNQAHHRKVSIMPKC